MDDVTREQLVMLHMSNAIYSGLTSWPTEDIEKHAQKLANETGELWQVMHTQRGVTYIIPADIYEPNGHVILSVKTPDNNWRPDEHS